MKNESGEASVEEENQKQPKEAGKFIKMKKFTFIMGIFLVIFLTAGITTIALTFGDEKVESLAPDKHAEFEKLYSTYDKIKDDYYEEVDEEKLVDGAINGMIESLDDPILLIWIKRKHRVSMRASLHLLKESVLRFRSRMDKSWSSHR